MTPAELADYERRRTAHEAVMAQLHPHRVDPTPGRRAATHFHYADVDKTGSSDDRNPGTVRSSGTNRAGNRRKRRQ